MNLYVLAALTLLGIPILTGLVALVTERPAPVATPRRTELDSASRAAWITGAIWLVLTIAGVVAVVNVDFYGTVASDRGDDISHAFTFLTALAVPVAAMVISVLGYSVLRRGSDEEPDEDGAAFDGRGAFPKAWFGVTAALTVLIMIYPGLVTLPGVIHRHKSPELVIDVQAAQWVWLVSYPDQGLQNQLELVVPVDKKITFRITSKDVVHSFWVPAFLEKIDAIPGRTTQMSLVATELGSYEENSIFRVQCAELCGLSHANMRMPVRVVSQSEFDDWVAKKKTATAQDLPANAPISIAAVPAKE